MFVRRLAALLVMLCASVSVAPAMANPVAAALPSTAYPPDEPLTVTVTNPEGTPGYPVEVVITGCVPGERVVVTIGGRTVEATCDPITLQVTVTIPAPDQPGDYDVVVAFPDRAEATTRIISIRVLSAGATTTTPTTTPTATTTPAGPATTVPGNLPRTGSGGVFGSLWVALVILVSGAGLVVVTRLRSSRDERSTSPSGHTSS
ncbi:MAG: hypothetical protein ABJH68_08230 [Ilumatobacter sp.]|uniref:hypothetical protein n=1 Tax=Ilumatobacter sp. TaxID=1967498 RepID=UPI003298EE6D